MAQIPKYQQGNPIIKEYKNPWLKVDENIGYDKEDLLKTSKSYIDELITVAKSNDKKLDETAIKEGVFNILNNIGSGVSNYKDNTLYGTYEGLPENIKDKKTSGHISKILKEIIDRTKITTASKEFPKKENKEILQDDFIDVDNEDKDEESSEEENIKINENNPIYNRTEEQIKENI